jgi:hypothetical protein
MWSCYQVKQFRKMRKKAESNAAGYQGARQ